MLLATVTLLDDLPVSGLSAAEVFTASPASRFERYARLARRVFGVQSAMVSTLDVNAEWFRNDHKPRRRSGRRHGQRPANLRPQTSRPGPAADSRLVSHGSDDVQAQLIIDDAHADLRFFDKPMVTGEPRVRFYAGQSLRGADGALAGTLFLHDPSPKSLSSEDRLMLEDLALMVERELAIVSLAMIDELTGLSNRRGFIMLAESTLSMCRRKGVQGTLLYIDLDDFKAINDSLGHAEGDIALRAFAELLVEVFRDSDVIARLGGDEFCVLLAQTSPIAAKHALNRFAATVAEYNARTQRGYHLAYSVGIASLDKHTGRTMADEVKTLMARADAQMYACKQAKS